MNIYTFSVIGTSFLILVLNIAILSFQFRPSAMKIGFISISAWSYIFKKCMCSGGCSYYVTFFIWCML